MIKSILGSSNDVIFRAFKIGLEKPINSAIIYIDGLVDKNLINQDILRPLMFHMQVVDQQQADLKIFNLIDFLQSSVLTVGEIGLQTSVDEAVASILSGHAVILINGTNQALTIDVKGWKTRNIEEPQNEVAIRGAKEGFNETIRINTALLRRRIRDPHLTFDAMQIGKRSKTDVVIAYIKGITNDSLIAEIKERLQRIDTDTILDTSYIEQFIEDRPTSLFPTVGNSQRPDVIAAKILEGRAAILVDGSPTILTVPFLFMEGFHSPDDYYARPYFATMVRIIRLFAFLISVILPSIYVALMSFHQELFPTPLLITVAAAKEGIPFPVVLEAIIMLLIFEILREAGLRQPRALGQAVSIVGALVIGQAAVSAGLVGAPMVIVVTSTAIASFLVVNYADFAAVLRLILTVIAGFLGLLGIVLVALEILSYMVALRSFGAPYLSPLTPINLRSWKDSLLRAPLWMLEQRPNDFDPLDVRRQSRGQKPGP
ncbi:MAG: spore germination protein [Methylocystaceae bacterium]